MLYYGDVLYYVHITENEHTCAMTSLVPVLNLTNYLVIWPLDTLPGSASRIAVFCVKGIIIMCCHINNSVSSQCPYSQGLDQTGREIISPIFSPSGSNASSGMSTALCLSCFCFSFHLCFSGAINLASMWTCQHGVNRFYFVLCSGIKAARHRGTKKKFH